MENKSYKNDTKICSSCGREIEYRKKWEKNWPEIKYCSDECRKNKNKYDFRENILALLNKRGPLKTICPSELLPLELKNDKLMMEHVRRSARLLAFENKIEITQSGKVVDPLSFKGPIRLKLK
ncbi:MAG: DUF2256 and DUF3253 domain-containing protein [Bacteriovoracaceae bacterium]|nr:DUF2256 and DUF3253 domain-containing protein [Bacteriovoracaceae bacterium]